MAPAALARAIAFTLDARNRRARTAFAMQRLPGRSVQIRREPYAVATSDLPFDGVKVLDLSEERIPTLRQAFIRDIGYIVLNTLSLSYLIYLVVAGRYVPGAEVTTLPGQVLVWASLGWFLLEIISMMTNDKRRAFHDYIAGTVVIRST